MSGMTNGGIPRRFHERFDIEVGADEARQRFINRVTNTVFHGLMMSEDLRESYGPDITDLYKRVVNTLGEVWDMRYHLETYINNDFNRCLLTLEILFRELQGTEFEDGLSARINSAIHASEIDLGIGWQPPIFVRTGASLLDEHLVNESLRWLAEPKYMSVRQPFEKGLSHYLEAQNRPDRLADVITDMYEAVEALAKIVTGRSGKDLSGNVERFISEVNASKHYKTLLRNYISYGNEFRHAEREGRPRPPLSEPEVESFIYLTGLFIRLAIRTTS